MNRQVNQIKWIIIKWISRNLASQTTKYHIKTKLIKCNYFYYIQLIKTKYFYLILRDKKLIIWNNLWVANLLYLNNK
jgi:hypothetical protein